MFTILKNELEQLRLSLLLILLKAFSEHELAPCTVSIYLKGLKVY